jgi:hypothetical protein
MLSDELVLVWRLYWPFLSAALIITAMLVARTRLRVTSEGTEPEATTFDVSLVFLSLPVKVKRSLFVYGFCSCAALWSLSAAFTRDYSTFFPTRLRVEVFYDRVGIEATLSRLSAASGANIPVAKNWWSARSAYYAVLDREAAPSLGKVVGFFARADAGVHSLGETTFVVKKIGGWQNYHIEESDGEVLHTLEAPNEPTRTLLTSFQKLDTSSDYMRPTFSDLVVRRSIVMRPRFKQYLSAQRTAASVPFKISIVSMTAIRIFPLPEFSSTLYFADVPRVGLVPIAYGVYVPDGGPAGGAPE